MNWVNKKLLGMLKLTESPKIHNYVLFTASIEILEDVLFWKKLWLTLYFIFLFNLVFFVCVYYQVNLLHFTFSFCATILIVDAFEIWLKYKHRTTFLKKLSSLEGTKLKAVFAQIYEWVKRRCSELIYLRESNHTKGFLIINIVLGFIYVIGLYINGYLLLYITFMSLFSVKKWGPATIRLFQKLQQTADCDAELESLIPDVSDADIQLLSVELEQRLPTDDRQSLDWKPDEPFPDDDSGDSSENSSSFVSNLSTKRMQILEEDVDTSDSSGDEYIPLVQQKEQLKSTLEILPSETWGSSAYNAFMNITGTLSNLVSSPPESRRKRISSVDSSDGFEIIDKNEFS